MNSDRKADYYVGLDMGTGSLGVAVTDPQYHLLKVKASQEAPKKIKSVRCLELKNQIKNKQNL